MFIKRVKNIKGPKRCPCLSIVGGGRETFASKLSICYPQRAPLDLMTTIYFGIVSAGSKNQFTSLTNAITATAAFALIILGYCLQRLTISGAVYHRLPFVPNINLFRGTSLFWINHLHTSAEPKNRFPYNPSLIRTKHAPYTKIQNRGKNFMNLLQSDIQW